MASRKTWVWIVVGALGVGLVGLVVVAGAGVYFVTHHIRTSHSSSGDAIQAFDTVKASFRDQRPLYELDSSERPRIARPLQDLPTSLSKPNDLRMLAWDPDEERLVNVVLPLWLLRFRKGNVDIVGDKRGFDFDRIDLDTDELERIGPALIMDLRNSDGARVLLWTQ